MHHANLTSRSRRVLVVLGLVVIGLAGLQHRASAHASLVSSQPADGAALSAAPPNLTLNFDEDIKLARSSAQLIDQRGTVIGTTPQLAITGATSGASTSNVVVIQLPRLGAGAYQVRWRALSALDLHVTSGTVVFGVGQSAGPSAAVTDPWPPAVVSIATWLQLLAVILLIGALAVGWLLIPAVRVSPPLAIGVVRRVRGLAVVAGVASISAGLAVFAAKAVELSGGFSPVAVIRSSFGHGWLAAERALVRRRDESRPGRRPPAGTIVAGGVLLVAIVLAQTTTSHLAATAGGSLATTIAACIHLIAVGLWVGALMVLAICLPALMRSANRGAGLGLVRRFGWLAAPCVAAVTISGLVLAGRQVATVDALLYTHYGRLLVMKVAVAAAVAVIGARNAFAARTPSGATPSSHRNLWLRAECVAVVVVIGLAGALANGKPARGPEYTPVSTAMPTQLNKQVDDLLLGLSIRPDRPGPDFVSVAVQNTRVPAPAPIAGVVVRYTAPPPLGRTIAEPATRGADGTWTDSTSVIDRSGVWEIHVVVSRAGMRDVALDTSWTVLAHPSSFTAHVRVSSARLGPGLDAVSGFLTAAAILGGLGFVLFRTRRREPDSAPSHSTAPMPVSSPR